MSLIVNPEFVLDLESRMRILTSEAYRSIDSRLWWRSVCKFHETTSRRELMFWLLDTAQITYEPEGNVQFEELSYQRAEYEVEHASRGLRVLKSQFEDRDGNGVNSATNWSRQIGAYSAYFPQKQVARVIKNGESFIGYDGKPLFAADHPLDPFNPSAGTYSNLITTGVTLDDRHPLDAAFKSLNVILKAVSAVPMPNGEDPRHLVPRFFLAPPAMVQRLNTLLGAKFIGLGKEGSGSTDVTGVVQSMGFKEGVIRADELGADYPGGSDTDCYLICEELGSPDMDALIWLEREPFAIQYYSGQDGGGVSADLGRARHLEWQVHGRNGIGAGHPYKIFKLKGQAPEED